MGLLDRIRGRREPDDPGLLPEAVFHPIGRVSNEVKEPIHEGWEEIDSRLIIKPELAEGLDGVEGFSHLLIIFWLDRVPPEKREVRRLHPRDRQDLPLVGVFATRTQYRPNPIGVSVVRLIRRRGNVLEVRGLDAIDGTPILDLKPYLPHYDAVQARLPEWAVRR